MHLTEGTGLAINCGDLALTMVTKTVLDDPTLESDVKLRVLHELTEMIVRTIEETGILMERLNDMMHRS